MLVGLYSKEGGIIEGGPSMFHASQGWTSLEHKEGLGERTTEDRLCIAVKDLRSIALEDRTVRNKVRV